MEQHSDLISKKEWSLQDYYNLVLRHKILIVSVFLIFFLITVIYSLSQKDRFQSSATFLFKSSESSLKDLMGGSSYGNYWDSQARQRKLDFYQNLLASRTVSDMMVRTASHDSLLSRLPESVVNDALQSVGISSSEKSDLIILEANAYSPIVAYRTAVLALDVFRIRANEVDQEEVRKAVDYIEGQKIAIGQKLEETERSLQQFLQNSPTSNLSNEQSGLLNKMVDLEMQLAEVKSQREMAENNLQDFDKRLRELKAADLPGVNETKSADARRLQTEMDRLINEKTQLVGASGSISQITSLDAKINRVKEELLQSIIEEAKKNSNSSGTVVDQATADEIRKNRIVEEVNLLMLKNKEKYMQQMRDRFSLQNPKLIDRAIEEAKLKRGKSVYEEMYRVYLEKGEEARIRAATGTAGIAIVDEPQLPKDPMPLNTQRNLLVGLVLGLGLGFGMAMALEMLDSSIRSNEDVVKHLGLSVLGTVPEILGVGVIGKLKTDETKTNRKSRAIEPDAASYQKKLISALRPRDPVVDTYRTICTNLQFAVVDKPISSILITSSIPGEGKTLTTANMGITFAEMGKRVVILDGDMRRPRMHSAFNIKRSPGLSDCLIKQMSYESVVAPSHVPNLHIIPCGTILPNPTEVISSKRMHDMIQQLQTFYDLVLIDSPPVTLISDAMLMSLQVNYVVLVTKFGSTNWRIALDAVNSMRHAKAKILGVILNSVKTGRGYGYYYKYNYYYYSEGNRKSA